MTPYRWKPTGKKLKRTRDRWIKQSRNYTYAYQRYQQTGTRPEQRTTYTREVRSPKYRYEQTRNVTKSRQVPNWKLYYQSRTDTYKERLYTLQKSETRTSYQRYYRSKSTKYQERMYTLQKSEQRTRYQRYTRSKSTRYQERVYTLTRSETRYRNFKRYYRRIYESYREKEYYKTEYRYEYCYRSWYGESCYRDGYTCSRNIPWYDRYGRCYRKSSSYTRTSRYYFSGSRLRYKSVSYCNPAYSYCEKTTSYGSWYRSYYSCSSNSTWTSGSYQYKCEGERYTHTWTETSNYNNGGKVSYKNVSYCNTRYSWCTATTTYGPWTKSSSSCSSSYTYDTYKCVGTPYTYTWTEQSRYTSGGKVIATTYTNVYYCDTRYSWCTSTTTYGPWTKSSLSCSSSYTYDTTKCVGTPYTYTWTEQSRYTTGGKVVGVNYKTVSYCDPTYSWCSMTSTYGAERPSGYTCAQMFGERNYSKQYNSRNGYYYTCRQEGTKTEYYTVKEWASTSWCDIRYSSSCRRFDDGYTAWTKSGSCSSAYSYTTSRCLAKTTTVNVPVYGWVDSTRACTYSEWFYGTCITNVGYTAWRDSGTCSSAYTRTLEKCVNRPETYYVDEYAWQKDSGTCTSAQIKAKECELRPNGGYTSWASVGVCTSEYSRTTERCKNYPYTVQVPIYDWFKRSGTCTAAQLAKKECELRRNGYTAWSDAGACSSVYNRDMERCKNYPYTVQIPIYDWFKGSGTCTPEQLKARQCEYRKNGYTAWTKNGTCSAASSATYVRCYNKPITVMVDEFDWISTSKVCSKTDRLAGK